MCCPLPEVLGLLGIRTEMPDGTVTYDGSFALVAAFLLLVGLMLLASKVANRFKKGE